VGTLFAKTLSSRKEKGRQSTEMTMTFFIIVEGCLAEEIKLS
jgi:hypothetical protein